MSDPSVIPKGFAISLDKAARYLLDVNHPQGGSKARLLLRFGFTTTDPSGLLRALVLHPRGGRFVGQSLTPLGETKLVYDGLLDTPDGRPLHFRTVWRVRPDEVAEFVTGRPIKDKS